MAVPPFQGGGLEVKDKKEKGKRKGKRQEKRHK
jgi:hypothetical protein